MGTNSRYILIAEDDEDDQFLLRLAFSEARASNTLVFVQNGIELLGFFNESGRVHELGLPALLIVDLNMPKKNGREAIRELSERSVYRHFPTVVFSTTVNEFERSRCEELGITSFFVKPSDFNQLVGLVAQFTEIAGGEHGR